MSRIARAAIAVALTLAFGAIPLVADWCAASCEASQSDATAAMAPCHHADSPGAHIGHRPTPCGQGHHPIVIDAAATGAPASPTSIAPADVMTDGALATSAAAVTGDRATPVSSRRPPLPLALSSPLRI